MDPIIATKIYMFCLNKKHYFLESFFTRGSIIFCYSTNYLYYSLVVNHD